MNEQHEFYDPKSTGHCQIVIGVGVLAGAIPSRCWLTKKQHEERAAEPAANG